MRHVSILMFVLLASIVQAAEPTEPLHISLDLTNEDMAQALAVLSQKSHISILGDSTVRGKVTCKLSDVTSEQALDVICKMNKLVWLKVYTYADSEGKSNASKLFSLVDSLKKIGGSAMICEDPKAGRQMIFVPDATVGEVDIAPIASALKLKPIYLVRAEPDPEAQQAAEKRAEQQKTQAFPQPPADPQAAAQQVWGYFGQMPMEQQFQVMRELRQMMFQNLTPEQREALREWGRGRRGDGSLPSQSLPPGR